MIGSMLFALYSDSLLIVGLMLNGLYSDSLFITAPILLAVYTASAAGLSFASDFQHRKINRLKEIYI
jgi:hypothetical protein